MIRSVISGTGCYIPTEIKTNRDFTVHNFYNEDHLRVETPPAEVVEKFRMITGIEERRYAQGELNASDIGGYASLAAIENSGIDPETIDQIICAHNFGNVMNHTIQTDAVPSLASRIKHDLGIRNPSCIAYDILFGCPGWLQGVIQAHAFFRAGIARKALIVGTETLSRVLDAYDRDSMIFSDGAGACILEYKEVADDGPGILGFSALTHAIEEVSYIHMGSSNFPNSDARIRYIKMKGRKVFEYAMRHVPEAMRNCLQNSGVEITDVRKIFIHQANAKMDDAIVRELYRSYGYPKAPPNIMPMNIYRMGNSSVATIPTLYDQVLRGLDKDHQISHGDVILFASVGAGMNINAVCYRY